MPEHIIIPRDKLDNKRYKAPNEIAKAVSKSVNEVSKRVSKTPHGVNQILVETALVDLLQTQVDKINPHLTSFKVRLELEDAEDIGECGH